MSKRMISICISLLIIISSGYLLITSSSVLERSISHNSYIPIGTLTTWLGIISFSCLFLFGMKQLLHPSNRIEILFSKILKGVLLIAVLWLPISYLLAGNLAFNFSNTPHFQGGQLAMKLFWIVTYSVLLSNPFVVICFCLISFLKKEK